MQFNTPESPAAGEGSSRPRQPRGRLSAVRYGLLSATFVVLMAASFTAGARYGVAVFSWLNLWGLVSPAQIAGVTGEPPNVAPTFSVFWEAWSVVTNNFVNKNALNVQKMTWGAIRGMVDSLGDTGHSRFLDPQAFAQEQGALRGRFIGIGAEIGIKNGRPVVIAPLEGSPAEKAGLKAGDAIIKINGEDVIRMSLSEIMNRVRGDAGTTVTLTVIHQGSDVLTDLSIVRARITTHPVSYAVLPDSDIVDIRISQFSSTATSELQDALKAAQGRRASGVVLDLRDNPGGILGQAVNTASQFLKEGTVVIVQDKDGKQRRTEVRPGGVATEIPLVVLVNNGTASAAEIVAGALEDNHRATVIGQTTFGTGTVLSTYRLKDGSALLVGTELWLTPNGRTIKDRGIQPNLSVDLPSSSDELTPAREKQMTAAAIEQSGDAQLLAAIKHLRQPAAGVQPSATPG